MAKKNQYDIAIRNAINNAANAENKVISNPNIITTAPTTGYGSGASDIEWIRIQNAAAAYNASNPIKTIKNTAENENGLGTTSLLLSSKPYTASSIVQTLPVLPVKTASIDTILFDDESVSIDQMADFIFEEIGGQELINIARSDVINGQKILHQPIKNLSSIQQRYNPNNILSLQQTSDKYFAGFSIKLENKIPNEGNGVNGENVYIDENTGDIIIELVNLNPDEQVEIQITVGGTIYEADLGDYIS